MTEKADDGWKGEATRLRRNFADDSEAMRAFVGLMEQEINHVNSPVLCLALHHLAMRFHSVAGKKTIKKMLGAKLEALPEAIYPAERIPKNGSHD